jgi:aminoglycoside phosphotransferase (APT) family kinase protein
MELNIENRNELVRYLESTERIGPATRLTVTPLTGGVSNRTVLVEQAHGPSWVLKQALPKLRVADDWFCSPLRIQREALGLQWLEKLAPGSVPHFVFEDRAHHLFAMTAVPQPHDNWKTVLLAGTIQPERIRAFGQLLGRIHQVGPQHGDSWRQLFSDRSFFHALRLNPYYRTAAARNPAASEFVERLICDSESVQESLVHGDFSPKNILVYEGRLVLLDFEVIHFGDSAFDLGFSLTHLLSKAHHLQNHRSDFLEAAQTYWESYTHSLPTFPTAAWEDRAVRHTLGCLLARTDGRSPLEYLTTVERGTQRKISIELMGSEVQAVPKLIEQFGRRLNR